jgi:hypothetical protein
MMIDDKTPMQAINGRWLSVVIGLSETVKKRERFLYKCIQKVRECI